MSEGLLVTLFVAALALAVLALGSQLAAAFADRLNGAF